MRYEMMFPEQIRNALSKQIPVVLPAGVLEYHGEHLVLGVDTILIVKALEEIEKAYEDGKLERPELQRIEKALLRLQQKAVELREKIKKEVQ